MPRPRPLRTKEEIAAVPEDKPVTIALDQEGETPPQDDLELQPQDPPAKVKKAKVADEDDPSDLKKQLEELKRAKEDSDRRVQEEIRARQEAERLAQERQQEASRSQVRAEDAEYDAILNAIGAAESEAEKAQQDMALASENADHKALADANRRLSRAESRLVQLNDGKDAIEQAKTKQAQRERYERENPRPKQPQTVEDYISALPNLMQSQRDWLRNHPEALTDTRKNMRLQGAHVEAEDQGFRAGSTEYFDYLDQRLGYKAAQQDDAMDDDEPTRAPVAAPPSRQATNPGTGRPSNNKITLTPEQREIARLSGIDELTYARQLQKLQQMKSEGQYQ